MSWQSNFYPPVGGGRGGEGRYKTLILCGSVKPHCETFPFSIIDTGMLTVTFEEYKSIHRDLVQYKYLLSFQLDQISSSVDPQYPTKINETQMTNLIWITVGGGGGRYKTLILCGSVKPHCETFPFSIIDTRMLTVTFEEYKSVHRDLVQYKYLLSFQLDQISSSVDPQYPTKINETQMTNLIWITVGPWLRYIPSALKLQSKQVMKKVQRKFGKS